MHLTTLDDEKQVGIIEEIVRSRSWYQKSVLQFYVGLVGLNNSKVFNTILEGCCVAIHPYLVDSLLLNSQLLSFLLFVNCVFEAQACAGK